MHDSFKSTQHTLAKAMTTLPLYDLHVRRHVVALRTLGVPRTRFRHVHSDPVLEVAVEQVVIQLASPVCGHAPALPFSDDIL